MTLRAIILICLLPSLLYGLNESESQRILGDIEEKAANLRGDKLDKLIDAVLSSEDPKQLQVLVEHSRPRSLLTLRFRTIDPSRIADRLLVALIARPWATDRGKDGAFQSRNLPSSGDFVYYATYMQKRLGHAIVEPTSDEQLLKVAASQEERIIIAREFERELVKAGLASPEERTIPDTSPPAEASGPRKDPRLTPPTTQQAKEAKEEPKPRSRWIAAASAVLLVVAGFFAFRRKVAKA